MEVAEDEDMLQLRQEVKIYSVVVGLFMLILFVTPCVVLAFVAKLFQKKTTPTRKGGTTRQRSSVKLNEDRNEVNVGGESDMSWNTQSGVVEIPANRLEYIEQIAQLKHGMNCMSTWKAYAPSILKAALPATSNCSDDTIIAVRKIGIPMSEISSREKHNGCLRMELNGMACLPPSHCILNLLGLARPNPSAAPSALLFEYPLYGSLHSFLTCKMRGIKSDNSTQWAGLEYRYMEPSMLSALPESSRQILSPLLADSTIRSRPFTSPLNQPLSQVDVLLFALQLVEAMEFLEKSRVIHHHLSAERIIVSSGFYLKLSGMMSNEVPQAHSNLTYSRERKQNYRGVQRWSAPEVLLGQRSTRMSEVWRFGMILWEICSLGETPLAQIPTRALVDSFKELILPPIPENCSRELYSMMLKCWRFNPEQRPTMAQLLEEICGHLEKHHGGKAETSGGHACVRALISSTLSSRSEHISISSQLSSSKSYGETEV